MSTLPWWTNKLKLPASRYCRNRKLREVRVFSLSVLRGWGRGGTPWSLVPGPFHDLWSQVLSEGIWGTPVLSLVLPSPVQGPARGGEGGTPCPGQGSTPTWDKEYPLARTGGLHPLARTGDTPPPHHHHREPERLCGAGGIPLAFMQEDFLVF